MQERLNAARRAYEAEQAKKRAEELARTQLEQARAREEAQMKQETDRISAQARREVASTEQAHEMQRNRRMNALLGACRDTLVDLSDALIDSSRWEVKPCSRLVFTRWFSEVEEEYLRVSEIDDRPGEWVTTKYEVKHEDLTEFVGYTLAPRPSVRILYGYPSQVVFLGALLHQAEGVRQKDRPKYSEDYSGVNELITGFKNSFHIFSTIDYRSPDIYRSGVDLKEFDETNTTEAKNISSITNMQDALAKIAIRKLPLKR